MQNTLPGVPLSPEEETEEEVNVQEKEKMINISYELAAEASKRSKLVAGISACRGRVGGGREGGGVHAVKSEIVDDCS